MNYKLIKIGYLSLTAIGVLLWLCTALDSITVLDFLTKGQILAVVLVLFIPTCALIFIYHQKYPPKPWRRKLGYALVIGMSTYFIITLLKGYEVFG